jgi:hypothetical protein
LTLGLFVVSALHVAAQAPVNPGSPVRSSARSTTRVDPPRILPGTRADVFSAIQGNALSATNSGLSEATVRLRDARFGQIVQLRLTDKVGIFAFHAIEPGSYIVEIIGTDQSSVLAASQVLYVGAGEALSAIVKLPFRIPALDGVLGNTTSSALAVASQAASAGVLATQVTGAGTCDLLNP